MLAVGPHRHPARRRPASLLAVALVAFALAGCGGSAAAPTDTFPVAKGSPVQGSAYITVSGPVSFTMTHLGTCRSSRQAFEVLFEAVVAQDVYLLEISADGVSPGDLQVGTNSPLTATLSNNAGSTWDGTTTGSTGHVTVHEGLSGGTIDVTLANAVDSSTVHATGTWTCGVAG